MEAREAERIFDKLDEMKRDMKHDFEWFQKETNIKLNKLSDSYQKMAEKMAGSHAAFLHIKENCLRHERDMEEIRHDIDKAQKREIESRKIYVENKSLKDKATLFSQILLWLSVIAGGIIVYQINYHYSSYMEKITKEARNSYVMPKEEKTNDTN